MNIIKVYAVFIDGKYQGWYESKEMAENFIKCNKNATYKLMLRYWG